jgi:glycosyltransferase involved in cell wall biosynthesis
MRAALRDIDPDVLHAHYLTGYGWLARIAGFHPYVVTTWGSDVYRTAPSSAKTRLFARMTLGSADLVTADSQDLAETSIRFGARRDRTRIVQFGVDTKAFAPGQAPAALREAFGLGDRRVIFSPRAITPTYRHEVLLRAMPRLPEDIVAVFVQFNAHAPTLANLEALAIELGVRGRVRFVDAISHADMPSYLRLADIVVSLPDTDGTPVSVLEAMAVGRPVVVTDLPSLREWLADIDPDALVPPGDPERVAEAIRMHLERDPAATALIAERARMRVTERADQDESLGRVERQYRALAERRVLEC